MLSSTDLSVEVCAERRAADAVGGEGAQCFTLSNADGRRRQRRLAGTDADKNADTDAAAVQVTPISACLGTPAASIPGVNPSLPIEGVRSPHCTQDQPYSQPNPTPTFLTCKVLFSSMLDLQGTASQPNVLLNVETVRLRGNSTLQLQKELNRS